MQRTNKILAMTALKVVFAIAIAQITAALMFGQDIRNTDYNPDKTLKSNARVNPSTLAMELSIPISGFPGRAGNGMPVAFNYSSKVWEMQHAGAWPSSAFGVTTGVNPKFAKRTAAGWSSSLGTPRIDYTFDWYRDRSDVLSGDGTYEGMIYSPEPWQEPAPPDPPIGLYYIKRVNVQMPDGSSHEFRASDAPIACGDMDDSACTAADLTGTFLSVDGSKMRLEVALGSSTLYLPDGGRYVFGTYPGSHRPNNSSETNASLAHTFIDRHGNRMTYNSVTHVWIDTLGRNITDPFPTNWTNSQLQAEGTQNAAFPSFGSNNMEVEFTWSHLKDPDGTNHALDDTNEVPHNVSSAFCQGNFIHDVTGPYLFHQTSPITVICGPGFTEQGPPFNPVVLTKIELPNGQSYQFKYNVFGEVVRIIYPTGAYERFAYQEVTSLTPTADSYYLANRGVSDRWLSSTGNPIDEVHWSYTASRGTFQNPTPYTVTTFSPDGTKTEQFIHDQRDPNEKVFYGFSDAKVGRSFEDRVYSSGNPRQLLRRNLTEYEETEVQTGLSSTYPKTATRDMRPTKQISITFEPGNSYALAAMTETVYDTSGNSDPAYFSSLNPKQQKTYDYVVVSAATAASANLATAEGWFASATPKVVTEMDYLYDANYMARNITGLVTETRVEDANGNVKAKSQITYDGLSLLDESESTRWENPNTNYRGLVTKTRSWYDITNNLYVDTQAQYDLMGNLRYSWDGRNQVSETLYSSTYDYAYPTSVKTPIPDPTGVHGLNTELTSSTVYDYNTGLPTESKDANNQITELKYDDLLLRPTKVIAPNGQQTITEYGAGTSEATRWVKVKSQIDATNWKEAVSWFDGLGRTYKSQSIDSESGDVFVETQFDAIGRPWKTSNPYRTSDTKLWTENFYDTAGRLFKVKTPDNAEVVTGYGLATAGSQIGTTVTVTDQAGKLRRSITNGIGQLTRVDEPNASNQLGAVDNPNQYTAYSYDLLNNLITVNQGVQTRTFSYDNLSRLESAVNPESGTINYAYDSNGNLATKVDARGVQTDYVYDALNRVTNRNYSTPNGTPGTGVLVNYQDTPDVSYYYDLLTNAKGKLIKVYSTVSTTEYTSFDILGRVTDHKQTTGGEEYATEYTYNLSGALIEETYPSGRKVKNTLDADGNLSQVQSRTASDTFKNYANSFVYTAAGAVSSMRLGNGRWENTTFNSRLQPTQIGLGSGATSQNLLKLNYDYGTTANNGNILSQTITVPTVGSTGFTAVQTYTYDSLNRINDAVEDITPTGGSTSQSWKQAFTYDRYGNRNFDEANTTTLPKSCLDGGNPIVCASERKFVNPEILASNNRIKSDQDGDSVDDYVFDSGGNTTKDVEGRTFVYDAENKQVSVSDANGTIGQYFYDGDGKRVKKIVPSTGEVTVFVYDAAGKLIGEYSTVTPPTEPKVAYLTNDHLGSPRITTDTLGQVVSRRDFMPFGEEIYRPNYGSDSVRQKFTGYERDNETGLDFAQARYHDSKLGRFSSPDPIQIKFDRLLDPQRLNRFIYVRNSPLKYYDPDGRDVTLAQGIKRKQQNRIIKNMVKIYQKKSGREAIKSMDASKVNYEMRVGKLPTVSNDVGTFENYGRFQLENPKGTVDGNGKVASIEKDGLTVSITLDFEKFDQTQREILDGDRSVGELPSETDVVTHEYGHGNDFESDPVRNYNSEPPQNEKKANEFTEKLREEEDSMTKEDAEREVRKLLGI